MCNRRVIRDSVSHFQSGVKLTDKNIQGPRLYVEALFSRVTKWGLAVVESDRHQGANDSELSVEARGQQLVGNSFMRQRQSSPL
jgi:hypothetical protein